MLGENASRDVIRARDASQRFLKITSINNKRAFFLVILDTKNNI